MAKIINSASGPIPPDPNEPIPKARPARKEVVVTPDPKTKAQRRANKKAVGLAEAAKRQEKNAYVPHKLRKGQKKARRKRIRDIHFKAMEADLERGTISPERARELLPKRQNQSKNEHSSSPGPHPYPAPISNGS